MCLIGDERRVRSELEITENDIIKVENGTDVILTLLFAGGSRSQENEEVVGNTRLVKLLFLLKEETSLKVYLKDFSYEPYNFGPFSSELFDALQALINKGLVKAESQESEGYLDEADRYQIEQQSAEEVESPKATMKYELTDEGKIVAAALYRSLTGKQKDELTAIKKTFNSISLRSLLQYVYRKYPNYTTESVIKDYVY